MLASVEPGSPAGIDAHDTENAAQRERGVVDLDRIAVEPYALERQRERPRSGVVNVVETANVGDGQAACRSLTTPSKRRSRMAGPTTSRGMPHRFPPQNIANPRQVSALSGRGGGL